MKRRRRLLRRLALAATVATLAALGVVLFEVARLPDVGALVRAARRSTVLLDRRGEPLHYALTPDDKLCPSVRLAEVSPQLVAATIAAEDARFRGHAGVDLLAAGRALWTNLRSGRTVSGASTITMQVARLLRPLQRGYYAKFREALLALRIEAVLDKDRILELYLNLSPYGGNLHGVEAAARRYFGRSPGDLSLSEAALLAGLPQSPSRLRPDRHPAAARARRDWILERMAALGMVSPAAAAEARAATVNVAPAPPLRAAPHFCRWVLGRSPPGARLLTTLAPELQALAEEVVRAQQAALAPSGVRNGAAVVVETESGRIRALVGSQDFLAPRDGQVNGAAAPRSPGSLLKPFIYALAFERGLIGPETILHDTPRGFRDGYDPRNFSGRFLGPVTAREALVRSLNVPAVDVLARVGVEEAVARLRTLGLRGLHRAAEHYGLALGLGGVEVTLLELVEGYAVLGRLGLHRPLSFREDEEPAPARRVLSAAPAYQVLEVLEDAGWPRGERDGGLRLPRVALKTGTSFGLRDAWAVATTPRFTVGVWFGNFDAAPSPALVGQSAAAPAALELVRRLEAGGVPGWFVAPAAEADRPAPIPPAELPAGRDGELRWLLPPDGATFARHERPGGDRLFIAAELAPAAGAGAGRRDGISVFVDGTFAGRAASGETLSWPVGPGAHRVTLVTPDGRSETRAVEMR
jgi:penicillin-binding protein 1C